MPITADKRSYVAGKYGIELDGTAAGWVQGAVGGLAVADVVTEKLGPDHLMHKHLAGVKYEDIEIQAGTGMTKGFYEWIKNSWTGKYARKNGAIVTCDYNYQEHSRLEFTLALLSETKFPALDAASKDSAKMTVKLSPEATRIKAGSKSSVSSKYAVDQKLQKKWLPSNFKLTIDGLDCTRVNKIEALTVKQKVVENPVGELRDYEKEPSHLEFSDLVVTLSESHAADWYKWHEEFVIKGNNGPEMTKTAKLIYLTPNLQDHLFTVTCHHIGIFKLQPEKVEAGSENIRRVRAEMYVESMELEYADKG